MSFFDRFTKSNNPLLKEESLSRASSSTLDGSIIERADDNVMTVSGAVNKSFLMGLLLLLTATYSYANPSGLFLWGGAIGGLVLVLIMSFKRHLSPTLAPVYALLEGLFVGSVTAIYAAGFGAGIVFQAVLLTISLLFMMLFVYKTGLIRVTQKFRTGIMMATGGIFLVYLLNIGLSFFGINMPFLHEGGMIGIGISLFIIGIATLNLLLDFDSFDQAAAMRAPKYMEWFCAMGLIVTLVWLYIEVLRLLSILSSND
ncbi:Bax inhibitor-1/YccA family protein [Neolewinella lacunae]|uniref:Bax inhibitor-1/YccA family protein n=1 Tax=Neolewinella lacunae TaxID=1517758 RepID=A0A923PNC2_9BACT|nr:Bax inhibitor-1/YccA family protein [Neolewinella lacunae]MBC6995585.1 Bax inhibitor-1/YccA family protein [Neolewinella lacunae]MDN3635621.1 Bax inhibitor-1/YccA family protein [Neolewinella lacunae]